MHTVDHTIFCIRSNMIIDNGTHVLLVKEIVNNIKLSRESPYTMYRLMPKGIKNIAKILVIEINKKTDMYNVYDKLSDIVKENREFYSYYGISSSWYDLVKRNKLEYCGYLLEI